MNLLEQFFALCLLVQIIHSVEEIITGFHKKWYAVKMSFWVFVLLELIFEGFWIAVYLFPYFPSKSYLQAFFLVLMFANGIQHVIWAGNVKKYVPGLITATMHIVIFLLFYFQAVF